MSNFLKILIITLILVISLSFLGLALAGDCGESGFGQNVPSISYNYQYPQGWFDGSQKLALTSSGDTLVTQFIPAGANVNVHVSGVVGFWKGWSHGHDAAYVYDAPPGSVHYPVTSPVRALLIIVDNNKFNPQPPEYNPNHVYDWQTVGTGNSLTLKIGDSYYDDNSGNFSVTITW